MCKMKLLFIANVGYKFNTFAYSCLLAAQKLNIEFHIAANWTGYNNPEDRILDEQKYGIKIHQIDFIRAPYDLRNFKAYKQVVHLIKDEQIDIIHCNTPIGGFVGRLAGLKCDIKPVIYQAHGFHFWKGAPMFNWLVYYPIERWLARYTDALITINQEDFKESHNFTLRSGRKPNLVHGVGIKIGVKVDIDRSLKRKEIGVPEDAFIIVSAGELNKNKNTEVIVRAIKTIEGAHYVVCGVGPERDSLLKLAKDLGITERVHLLGYRTDMAEVMAAADVFAIMSFREGLPRSLMEAMDLGLPCVGSTTRGITDLIDENGGFICKPTDDRAFAKAFQALMNNPQLVKQMGFYNKEKVKTYSTQIVSQEMIDIYMDNINQCIH